MIRNFYRTRRCFSTSILSDKPQQEAQILQKLLLTWTNQREDRSLHVHDSFVTKQKNHDLDTLITNFTAPALARALRDRELTLARLSDLAKRNNISKIKDILQPFSQEGFKTPSSNLILPDLTQKNGLFQQSVLNRMKYRLGRIPREITSRAHKRACVVVPLCTVRNEACVVLTKRSGSLRTHSGELCFPGGMVDEKCDQTIVQAGLREMEEEIGLGRADTDVLGILRLDWVEVKALTGVAVTPVVGFLRDFNRENMRINEDEVEDIYTVPIKTLLDRNNWKLNEERSEHSFSAVDVDGKSVWGLTGYVMFKFMKLLPSVVFENYREFTRSQSF